MSIVIMACMATATPFLAAIMNCASFAITPSFPCNVTPCCCTCWQHACDILPCAFRFHIFQHIFAARQNRAVAVWVRGRLQGFYSSCPCRFKSDLQTPLLSSGLGAMWGSASPCASLFISLIFDTSCSPFASGIAAGNVHQRCRQGRTVAARQAPR